MSHNNQTDDSQTAVPCKFIKTRVSSVIEFNLTPSPVLGPVLDQNFGAALFNPNPSYDPLTGDRFRSTNCAGVSTENPSYTPLTTGERRFDQFGVSTENPVLDQNFGAAFSPNPSYDPLTGDGFRSTNRAGVSTENPSYTPVTTGERRFDQFRVSTENPSYTPLATGETFDLLSVLRGHVTPDDEIRSIISNMKERVDSLEKRFFELERVS
jgi:hypothetical protein